MMTEEIGGATNESIEDTNRRQEQRLQVHSCIDHLSHESSFPRRSHCIPGSWSDQTHKRPVLTSSFQKKAELAPGAGKAAMFLQSPQQVQAGAPTMSTSNEKQRKLHRRGSDDSTLLRGFAPSSPGSPGQEQQVPQEAPADSMKPPPASARIGETTRIPLAKKENDFRPLLSPQKRRRYQRRNSFVIRKNNPFTSQEHEELAEVLSSPDALLKSILQEGENIGEQGCAHTASARHINAGVRDASVPLESFAEGDRAVLSTPTETHVNGSGSPPPVPLPPLLQEPDRSEHCEEWANRSWADSDDTKWYNLMSTLSFQSGSGEPAPRIASPSGPEPDQEETILGANRQPGVKQRPRSGSEPPAAPPRLNAELDSIPAAPEVVQVLDSATNLCPQSIKEQTRDQEQIRSWIKSLTEDSPKTPRLLAAKSSKVVRGNDG